MATTDLLLHPVRMRILRALLGSEPLTTAGLRGRLPDIPVASMYRHIALLVEAGVLEVAAETRVGGVVERAYRVRQGGDTIDDDARAAMTAQDHSRAFAAFAASLASDFDRYVAAEGAEPTRDGVVYRQAVVRLTDGEFAELLAEIEAAVLSRTGRDGGEGRRRRTVSLVVVPEDVPGPGSDREGAAGAEGRSGRGGAASP